jgi:membrane associated rhomboid family serine protease
MKDFLQRLKEPSTWSAIAVLFGLAGYTFSDEAQAAFVALSGGVYAVINIFWKKDTQSQ